MAEVAAHHGLVFIGFMAAGKTRAAKLRPSGSDSA